MTAVRRDRIDVHHHFLPRAYVEALAQLGVGSIGSVPFPAWDPESMAARLDELGVARAILSISAPGVSLGDPAFNRWLARRCNDAAAELGRESPDRIGSFAALPLPDVDAALEELAYSLDVLGADGVVLLSNYDGTYLSDERLRPVLDELDAREAVAFVHPAMPPGAAGAAMLLQPPLLEFAFDTTRVVAELIAAGIPRTHSRARIVLAHLGGTLPFLAWRLSMLQDTEHAAGHRFREHAMTVEECLRWFWYETATAGPDTIAAATAVVGPDRLLYGSDVPFVPAGFLARTEATLAESTVLAESRDAIDRANAERLFGREADL